MIASDDNNPQFLGAHDPDARLHVLFYLKTEPNEFETAKQGRPIFYECDFVRITAPGDKLNIIDTYVNESHKQRFPKQWQHYLNNKKAETEAVIGTPLSEWPLISRAQAEELRYLGFKTVDSIANASDQQLQSLGMKAGMQPHAFRERAQRFLSNASAEATVNAAAEREAKLMAENDETRKALAELQEQMAAMQTSKPGRKPRQTETA